MFEIWKNDTMTNQSSHSKEYQKILEQNILKLNHKSFHQVVVLGSSSFIPFMQLKASDRRTIIEDLLDIEIFSVMNQLLKVRVAQNKEDMGTVDIALGLSKGEKENVEYLIEKLKQNKSSQIEANKRDIQTHEQASTDYRESIDKILDKNKELNDSIADEKGVRKEVAKLLDYQKGIEKGILKCEEDIEFYEKTETCDTCKQQISEDHRENMIEEFHGKLNELSRGLMQLSKKL